MHIPARVARIPTWVTNIPGRMRTSQARMRTSRPWMEATGLRLCPTSLRLCATSLRLCTTDPEGVTDDSRGQASAPPPVEGRWKNPTPKGSRLNLEGATPSGSERFLTPDRGRRVVRSRALATPPAIMFIPCGDKTDPRLTSGGPVTSRASQARRQSARPLRCRPGAHTARGL